MINALKTATMDRLRRIMYGASAPSYQYLLTWSHIHSKEIKSVLLICIAFLCALGIQKNHQSFVDIVSLYKVKVEEPSQLYSRPLVSVKNNMARPKVNVEDLISTTMTYSYDETKLGFYLKNFKFFNRYPKAKVERKILASLPKGLAKNAGRYVRAVLHIAQRHQVDPIWVLSVMWTESHFQFKALSHAGARGLMQIMPATKKHIYYMHSHRGRKLVVETEDFNVNNYFPYKVSKEQEKLHIAKLINIELGVIYLKSLLRYFDKNHKYATVAYNMGPGWTRHRLKNNLPVGNRNEYLDKVTKAYKQIAKKI